MNGEILLRAFSFTFELSAISRTEKGGLRIEDRGMGREE